MSVLRKLEPADVRYHNLRKLGILIDVSDVRIEVLAMRPGVHQALVDGEWYTIVPVDATTVELDF